jgi:hypothetical protein
MESDNDLDGELGGQIASHEWRAAPAVMVSTNHFDPGDHVLLRLNNPSKEPPR